MKTSKLISEIVIVISAFILLSTPNGLGFEIKTFWDYAAIAGILLGLYFSLKGGIARDATDF